MTKIAFQTNTLCHRGGTGAVLDYARYNKSILKNESVIVYPVNFNDPGVPVDSLTQQDVLHSVENEFTVFGYSTLEELDQYCKDNGIEYTYFLKYGINDGVLVPSTKNLVHAVFQAKEPHGDKYAYISKWLSESMSDGEIDYVPHIVSLPKDQYTNFRERYGISDNQVVIGRIGGLTTFDIPGVAQLIAEFANSNPNYVFLFVNTEKFVDLPNVLFLDPIIDLQEKTDFILGCDAMIHARMRGESFGLAICEALFHNKPVLAFNGGIDQHHVQLLKDTELLYRTGDELWNKLLNVKNNYPYNYSKLVEQFSPENVMDKFKKVFLS